jgi:hypothetical protein
VCARVNEVNFDREALDTAQCTSLKFAERLVDPTRP